MDFKEKMIKGMMDKFCSNMPPDEKNNMMNMMQNMMGGMTGHDIKCEANSNTPAGFNPMEMCMKMMSNIEKSNDLAAYATPEVRTLFEEWMEQIENEIMEFIKTNNNPGTDKIAENFKLSKNSVNFFLTRLAQKRKINIKTEAK